MEPVNTITIACEGAFTISLDEITDLQGNLKDLSESNYAKLRDSIITYGFSFPVFLWIDSEGRKWNIDSHQRVRTLKRMRDSENFAIPPLPAVQVHATDRVEAKKKLLLLNSRYGKMTREGYDEFIDEEGFAINESDIDDLLEIPEVQLWDENEADTTSTTSGDESGNPAKVRELECPHCHQMIKLFDNKAEVV